LKIKYSPDAKDKLRQIKMNAGTPILEKIMVSINSLSDNPRKCPTVENMLGIPSPYYFLHTEHNFIFYRFDDKVIYVTDIYNEREDFLWKMFGIQLRTQDSIDYWGE
jgi:hypothetical protein